MGHCTAGNEESLFSVSAVIWKTDCDEKVFNRTDTFKLSRDEKNKRVNYRKMPFIWIRLVLAMLSFARLYISLHFHRI
jgi:hypothetical protein